MMIKSRLYRHAATLSGLTTVAALCAVLGGCGSSIKTHPTVHDAMVSDKPVRESTLVAEGQTLTVRLPTTAGARFTWRMTADAARNGLLELEQRRDQQNANGQVAILGEPAWDVFTFRAESTGQVCMTFVYENLYSANAPASKYALDVDVVTPQVGAATASAE